MRKFGVRSFTKADALFSPLPLTFARNFPIDAV